MEKWTLDRSRKLKTAIIIENPVSGKSSAKTIEIAREILAKNGFEVNVLITQKRGDAERLAREAYEGKPDIIFISGGDGTINEAINGLADSDARIAIIPSGTANVLAMELEMPKNIEGIIQRAINGSEKTLCIGTVQAGDMNRHFFQMAGVGFDADAVFNVSEKLKAISGKLSYIISGLKVLFLSKHKKLKVTANGKEFGCYHVIASNGKKYGGNHVIAPEADISNAVLEVTMINKTSVLSLAAFTLAMLIGVHKNLSYVETITSDEISVEGEAHTQVDGDYFGLSPVKITIKKSNLKIIS
jgi:YegS/Rv2252/BmrU family lipid kinase